MRKLFAGLLIGIGLLFAGANINPAQSAQVANVEYIHLLIKQEWGIEVPYYPENAKLVANMEYLLTVVDRANLMLNGEETTSYASDPVYATKQAVDTIAVNQAVETLIKKLADFYVTTTPNTSSFSFQISAAGDFTVDWGDGDVETINKTNTTNTTYSHTYDTAGEYTIGISGEATAYNTSTSTAAISFKDNRNTAGISGSLGAIFGTLPSGTQPRFYRTFYNNSNLTGEIPADLFAGISGTPASYMFERTFSGCSGLTGTIPENLFGDLSGAPADGMFSSTFSGCSGLTGIGGPLFAGISGSPAYQMFSGTFQNCSGLTGEIPLGLFGDLTNNNRSFMFESTFYNCSGLTGPSARMPDGTYLYNFFMSASYMHINGMYSGATGLSDYDSMPTSWKKYD